MFMHARKEVLHWKHFRTITRYYGCYALMVFGCDCSG